MTDDEHRLLECAAILRRVVTDAMEQLGQSIKVGNTPLHQEGKDALEYLKARDIDAVYPLAPLTIAEDVTVAAHRVFGNYIYNQVFTRPPGGGR